jgi:general secretion pathway protein K
MRLTRQRGVAVITALLLTTLAVSIVASLFWQQQVQVRSMENQRLHLQTKWILRGALDWATLVLRQDGYDHRTFTALDHVWATPLAETRLDQYIERERVEGEVFDATLSGNITDATSRYNLRNLANDGRIDTKQQAVFERLLRNLRLDPLLARRAAIFIAAGQPLTGLKDGAPPDPQAAAAPVRSPGTAPMKLLQVDDLLAVPGFTQAIVEQLRPFLVVLPEPTPVNVNTAAPEVLAALTDNGSMSEASRWVAQRKTAPWRDMANFKADTNTDLDQRIADVKSEYFLVESHIRLDRAALNAQALVNRRLTGSSIGATGSTTVIWIRQI